MHRKPVVTALSERKRNDVMLNIMKFSDVCLKITL